MKIAHAAYFSIYEATKNFLGADKAGHHPMKASLCGATAAFSHDLFMNPFDVLKQRMQLGYYRNIVNCATVIIKTEGFRALYISFPATLVMNVPYGCIMVPVNESVKKFLNPTNKYSFTTFLFSGAIAGGTAAALTNPLDVVKTRLQIQNLVACPVSNTSQTLLTKASSVLNFNNTKNNSSRSAQNNYVTEATARNSSNIFKAIQKIIVEEGYKGFLRGIYARILIQAPAVAISWTVYESMKVVLQFPNMNDIKK
jgi:solute carrier family 25 iron transporter 28/37